MKRFFLYSFSFLLIIILFFIIFFNKISSILKQKLENYISNILPEGSSYSKISIDLFESYVEELKIKDFGTAERIIIKYYPLELLLKRVRFLSVEDAEIFLKIEKNGEKSDIRFPSLKINEIKIKSLRLKFNEQFIDINSTLSLLSDEKKMLLRIKRFSCLTDYIDLKDAFGDILISDKILLNLYSVKSKNSEFEIGGNLDSLSISGKMFLSDLKNIPLDGEINFKLIYKDKKILGDGFINTISYKNYKIKDVSFRVKDENIYFRSSNFSGEIKGILKDNRELKIHFEKFDLSNLIENIKETVFSGGITLSILRDKVKFNSSLKGTFYGLYSDTLVLNGYYEDKIINFEKIYSSNGKIDGKIRFSVGDTSISGFINCNNLTFYNLAFFSKFLKDGVVSFQISFEGNNSSGSLWFERINGRNFSFKSTGVNFEIEDIKRLNGNFDIFFSDAEIYNKNIENVYFTGFFKRLDFETKGLIKSKYFTMKTEISKNNNILEIKKINIKTSFDTIFSISPTRIVFQNRNLNLSGFSLSNGGEFKTGLNLNLKRNGEIEGGLSVLNLNLRDIKNILDREVSGFIDIVMSISGRLENPFYTITLKGKEVGEEYYFGDSITVFLSGTKEKAELSMKIFERNKSSQISGEYNFKDKFFIGNIELRSASDWVFILFKEFVRAENTDVSGVVKFSGTPSSPEVFGNMSINNLNIVEKNSGITVYNLNGKVICENNIVNFRDFKGKLGNGDLNFDGFYRIKDKNYSLDFNIKNGYIAYDYYSAGFDCKINLADDIKGVKILGDVNVKEATVTLPFYFKESGNKLNKLYINMNVYADEGNVWLKNENADIEFSGNAKIFYDWGIPSAIGEFKVLQGSFKYLFTEFKIEDGKFTFSKRGDIDPDIKIFATHLAGSNDTIILSVSGSMKKPEFSIYSKPPKDLSEIILVLGLNISWQDLLNISSVNNTFTNTAFRAFDFWARSRLQSEVSKLLGMDVAKIEKYESYKLTLGKYITKNLYFQLGTEFYPTAKVEYNAEYRFSNWGTVKYKDTMDSRSLMLKLTIRY